MSVTWNVPCRRSRLSNTSLEPLEPMEAPTLRRLVVLGTGTGVGKTFVTVAVARALNARGCSVVAVKPVETGCVGSGEPAPGSDAWQLEAASTIEQSVLTRFMPSPIRSLRTSRPAEQVSRSRCRRSGVGYAERHYTIQHYTTLHYDIGASSRPREERSRPLSDSETNLDLALRARTGDSGCSLHRTPSECSTTFERRCRHSVRPPVCRTSSC